MYQAYARIIFPLFVLLVAACAGGGGSGGGASDASADRQSLTQMRLEANTGNADAQVALADMLRLGIGAPSDVAEAARLYRKPAEMGNPLGQYNLGVLYLTGRGVVQNLPEAARWFAKAADQGNPLAQYQLGVMYAKGQGVRLDRVKAFTWLTIAQPALAEISQDDSWYTYWSEIKGALGSLPTLKNALGAALSPADRDRAERSARAWPSAS